MKVDPYLMFNGNCAEALKFYEKAIGAKTEFSMTFGEAPAQNPVPPGWGSKIMHATFNVDGMKVMASDCPPEHYQKPTGFSVALGVKTPEEAERVYKALSENATIGMPLQKTFWSPAFAMLTDKYGIPWMVNCEQAA